MKKAVILLGLTVFMIMFFVVMVGEAFSRLVNDTPISNESVCAYEGEAEIDGLDLETQNIKEAAHHELSNKSLTNAVIGIYLTEKKEMPVSDIVKAMNDLHEYAVKSKKPLTAYEYIQAYKYGTDYIEWLYGNNLVISLSANKQYMKEVLKKDNDDYSFYVRVMSNINDQCVTVTDGLPLKKPFTITGWFPSYGKDGTGDKHNGIDVGVPIGTPVYAIGDGEVVKTWNNCDPKGGKLGNMCGMQGTGNCVLYKIEQAIKVYYVFAMHLEKPEVNAGDHIIKGQRIGTSGNSGNSSGAHLHTEIRSDDASIYGDENIVNPCDFIEGFCDQ